MNVVRFLAFIGLSVLPSQIGAMELSGTVLGVDRKPIAGVQVRLVGGNVVAMTDAVGGWKIQAQSQGIGQRDFRGKVAPLTTMMVEDGRIRVRMAGRDLAGRLGGEHVVLAGPGLLAGRSLGVPDTLTFSLGGKVLLRDTLSSSRAGIVRILDSTFRSDIVYGYLTDSRDGWIYRTVRIGRQEWMAENLSYKNGSGDDSGWWFGGSPDSGAKYGRLYTWVSLLDLADRCGTEVCASQVLAKHRGICPDGWRLPSRADWDTLMNAGGGMSGLVGSKLKSTGGWYHMGQGTDDFGFHAMPAGNREDGLSSNAGYDATWWSASEDAFSSAWAISLTWASNYLIPDKYYKTIGFSARCTRAAVQVP